MQSFKRIYQIFIKSKDLYLELKVILIIKRNFTEWNFTFSYLLEKKIKEITNKILKGNIESKDLRGQATFMTNYFFDWSQEDIINISKQNSDYYSS